MKKMTAEQKVIRWANNPVVLTRSKTYSHAISEIGTEGTLRKVLRRLRKRGEIDYMIAKSGKGRILLVHPV